MRRAARAGHRRAAQRTLAQVVAPALPKVVLVDGVRTPFLTSGTGFQDYIAQDLGRFAIKGLLTKTALPPSEVDHVVYGTVIQEVRTSNIARESALAAGIPDSVPAQTVTMACISSNLALANAASWIQTGHANAVVFGGVETMSDVPIRFSKNMRRRFLKLTRQRSAGAKIKTLLSGLRPWHLAPEAPAIAEFSTGETMGHSSDRLAARFGVSREEQDAYAAESHRKAAAAAAAGRLRPEITPVDGISEDNGIRADTTAEKLSQLRPAFVRPHGTHTAGNSSFLTDGASAALAMSEQRAKDTGFAPTASLKDWMFVSQDPNEELLLGPAYGIARMLNKHGIKLSDIDVVELHEAFAGQVLANLNALDSEAFCTEQAGVAGRVGRVDPDKLNQWGGALAIGHPFGATGARLVTTAANRLVAEDGNLAIIAACAAGGQGVCMLLERYKA